MDIKAYIESGVLELYAMEVLPPSELREVEALAIQYPEIKAAIEQTQNALNQYALLHARAPRPALKQQILDKVVVSTPVKPTFAKQRRQRIIFLIFAILGLVAIGFFIYKWQNSEQKLQRVVAENENLKAAAEQLKFLQNPETKAIVLENQDRPNEKVIVYWNPAQNKTFLSDKGVKKLKPGKQYQLWAIVSGKNPQDAGVFDAATFSLQRMKDIAEANILAVTVEPKGGSPAPTTKPIFITTI